MLAVASRRGNYKVPPRDSLRLVLWYAFFYSLHFCCLWVLLYVTYLYAYVPLFPELAILKFRGKIENSKSGNEIPRSCLFHFFPAVDGSRLKILTINSKTTLITTNCLTSFDRRKGSATRADENNET